MLYVDFFSRYLKSLPINCGRKPEGQGNVNEPIRPYLSPVAWLEEKDGIMQYAIAAVFSLPEGELAHVPWTGKRYAYERARYIENPDPALTAVPVNGVNTIFDQQIISGIKRGASLPETVWKTLRDAAEGPSTDTAPKARLA